MYLLFIPTSIILKCIRKKSKLRAIHENIWAKQDFFVLFKLKILGTRGKDRDIDDFE